MIFYISCVNINVPASIMLQGREIRSLEREDRLRGQRVFEKC